MSRLAVPLRDPVRPPQNRTAGNFATPTSGLAYGMAALLTFVIALCVRLLTVLRGGGLDGTVGYDGSVYYSAAAGLAHGLLPYRDFLLLHPPGILLALTPFAALGRLIGDPTAFALARLTWLVLGAANAVLVGRILRPLGTRAAVVGGLAYAVFVPALYSEHSTSLEAVGSTCLLAAVLLLSRAVETRPTTARPFVLAGLVLGASSGVKIWGVALALALAGWVAWAAGVRRAAAVVGAAVLGATAVCLPFFLGAPATMWRMVVLDQLGRRWAHDSVTTRLLGISGLSEVHVRHPSWLLLMVVVAASGLVLLAVRHRVGRLAALLGMVTVGVLLLTPSWSMHYAGLAAPPLALILGSAVASADRLVRSPLSHRLVLGIPVLGLVAYSVALLPGLTFGTPFSAGPLTARIATTPGCVTTDDPTVLIETDTLQRNLDRGCPFVVDLGGYSYDLQPGASRHTSRAANAQWQQFAGSYLRTGSATVVARFKKGPGFSNVTKQLIAGWPVLARSGTYELQQPGLG